MPIPTRRFWLLVALGVPLALLGVWVPGLERALVPYNALLLVGLLVGTLTAPRPKDLRVQRRFDAVLSVRVPNRVTLTLTNEGRQPMRGRVRDESPARSHAEGNEVALNLAPGQETTLAYHVTPVRRGSDFFPGTAVRVQTWLGLGQVEWNLATEEPVRIYPNVLALREFDLLKQRGRLSLMGIRLARMRGRGTEFESLRDYQDDDYRRIDWKTTARRGRLSVREYETERNQAVIVAIDLSRGMLGEVSGATKLDRALDATLMLLHAAADAGDQTGLLVYAETVRRWLAPRKGRNQAGAILDTIHGLQAEPTPSEPISAFGYLGSRWKRRSLLVVFTDCDDPASARELATALSPMARRHIVLVVRVRDPRVEEAIEAPSDRPEDRLYERASALWYREERRQASAVLSSVGIRNLEAEPDELAQALVTTYLQVKESGAL